MIENVKRVESLTVADLEANHVWQYENNDEMGETCVKPIKTLPVSNLTGKVVGLQVCLANGVQAWALVGNFDTENLRLTKHFVTLSIERNGAWFALARYHDYDFLERGPQALARFLDLRIDQIFPILVDVRKYVRGDPAGLAIHVYEEPEERLSRAEIIALAVA